MLLWAKRVRSGLRRMAWMKWLPPSEYMSPSPPTATTVSPGLLAFTAVAGGRARPWRPLKKWHLR